MDPFETQMDFSPTVFPLLTPTSYLEQSRIISNSKLNVWQVKLEVCYIFPFFLKNLPVVMRHVEMHQAETN